MPGYTQAQKSNDIPIKINGKKYYKHIVKKGETIYGIAEKYTLKPKDIVLENPSAIDGVNAGDTLLIPLVSAAKQTNNSLANNQGEEQPGNYIYHNVIGKETLYSLAKKYNTTIPILDSLNPEIKSKGLQKGQKIRIPVSNPPSIGENKPQNNHSVAIQDTAKTRQVANKAEMQAYKALVVEQTHADTIKTAITAVLDTGKKLDRYNIVLIMPFAPGGVDTMRLNHLVDGIAQIPQITQVSIDFYHGVTMALDSLAKKGFKANLHVYNILPGTDSAYHAFDSILAKPQMLSANLIIGPPYPSNFKKVAEFARKHHIPAVSPLSSESSVLKNNPWTSKVVPSSLTETEVEADYIVSNYRQANIIIVHNRDANDIYYKAFQKRFIKADSAFGGKDTLRHAESTGGVKKLSSEMSSTRVNIIVMPYQGTSFIAKFVNELANSKYVGSDSLILFGMHNWANNDALDPANLDTLNFHFPSNEFVNYSNPSTKKFILKYRTNYLSEPSYYSYEGYDAAMFYGNLLYLYGTGMQNHLSDNKYRGLQTSFNMFRSNPAFGYENISVYTLEYKNYTEKLDSK